MPERFLSHLVHRQTSRSRRRGVNLRGRFESLEDRRLLSIAGQEQLFVYLLNVARHDPAAYQAEQSLSVDLSSVEARPPLAVNDLLFNSAEFHAAEMATCDYFGHQSEVTGDWPNEMVRQAGYAIPTSWSDDANYVESLAAGTFWNTAIEVLNALVVDAGVESLGHRKHLLSMTTFQANDREIGVGWEQSGSSTYTNYWAVHITRHDPSDMFATGVVYNDADGDLRFDAGEGISGATVRVGSLTTTTGAAGGWSVAVEPGTYTVSVSGGGFSGTASSTVSFASQNVEIDFLSGRKYGVVDFGGDSEPAASADHYEVDAGAVYASPSSVLQNDEDADDDSLTAALVAGPSHGTLAWDADGTFRYTPTAGFTGTDTFTYCTSDGFNRSPAVTVTLDVVSGSQSATDLGTLAASLLSDVAPANGACWYRFTTTRAGELTAQATAIDSGDVELTLYDADVAMLATATAASQARIDYQVAAAGATCFLRVAGTSAQVDLRLANLVSRSDSVVTVAGTADEDTFQFDARSLSFTVADLVYHFAGTGAAEFRFDGGAGSDSVLLRGSTGDDSATLAPLSAALEGTGYLVSVENASAIVLRGQGGNDSAELHGSTGADTYQGTPTEGKLLTPGFLGRAIDFDQIVVDSEGGSDVARLYDSDGDESLGASPQQATWSAAAWTHTLHGFGEVHAFATGGTDTAELHDSSADDTFDALTTESKLYSAGLLLRVKGFDRVEAIADAGGTDVANLYGARGNDTFFGSPTAASLTGTGFENTATGFEQVLAAGKGGTGDAARFEGSADLDRYTATSVYGRLAGTGYFLRAAFFDRYYAQAVGTGDVATLSGSAGNDVLTATSTVASITGPGLFHEVTGFGRVSAYGGDGDDAAWLDDSEYDDRFRALANLARLITPSSAAWAYDFETVTVAGSTGQNERALSPVDYALTMTGTWIDV